MKDSEIIKQNLGLVKSVVSKYCKYSHITDDLVQEGLLGLLEARKRYNPKKGILFSTYATYWVRKKVLSYLKKNNYLSCIDIDELNESELPIDSLKKSAVHEHIFLPKQMPELEKTVLKQFFEQRKDLTEISRILNIPRERARQIKQKALRRLKNLNTNLIISL